MKMDTKGSGALSSTMVSAGASVVVFTGLLIRRWWRNRKSPPQLTTLFGLPILGPIIQFLKEPKELVNKGYQKCGECFKVNFLAMDWIFLVGPAGQEFFFTQDKYLDQAYMYSFTIPVFGPKVLYDTDYSTRMCQLRFIRERLTSDVLSAYVEPLEAEVRQFLREEWSGGTGELNLRRSMVECLTRTSIRCLMGPELRSQMHIVKEGHSVCELLEALELGMQPLSVFWPNAPIARHRERDNARKEMDKFLAPVLQERRKKLKEGTAELNDFLWKVMTTNYPDGRPVSDEEIVGFLVAAFFGGMHNSSITATWSILEIFTRPELVAALKEEQQAVLGDASVPFTYESYEKMKKLRSTVMEVLRLHPPLGILIRTVEQDVKFRNYVFRRGSVVTVNPDVAGMDPKHFPKPDKFDPWRFENGAPNEFAYIPFGGGRRLCKGQEFGYLQVICILSHLLRMYHVTCLNGVPPPTNDGMVTGPQQPCKVRYDQFSDAALKEALA